MEKGVKSRLIVHEILKLIKIKCYDFDKAFLLSTKNLNLLKADINLIHNVVISSFRYSLITDIIIKEFAKKIKKDSNSYFLLLSSITQIIFLDFKDFAVVNTAVEISKLKKAKAPSSFINAVLRNIIRKKIHLKKTKANFDQLPKWMKERVNFNKKEQRFFLKTIMKKPQLHIVFKKNTKIPKFLNAIITTKNSISILNHNKIEDIEGYNDGTWWVQDYSSMLPIHMLDNVKFKKVADLCSAPGGKSFQLIDKGAKLTSYEKSLDRCNLMKKNLKRLNLNTNLVNIDALNISYKNRYDIIIIDAPCSSIGTLRRNPEIIFRNNIPNFNNILNLQYKLLEKSKKLLNNNGIILYIVCSFIKDEGAKQIYKFLKKNKNFSLKKFTPTDTNVQNSLITEEGFFYTMPTQLNNGVLIDGFFASMMIKND